MKKIIAVLLSIQLVLLSTQPALADALPKRAAQAIARGVKPTPSGLRVDPRITALDSHLLHDMRPTFATQHMGLLAKQAYVPAARQILTHPNTEERALLLRTDFAALALQNKVSPVDQAQALAFYRTNLEKRTGTLPQTVADIASIGLLGEKQDAALILKVAKKSAGTPQEAAITAAAARALLRLGAYDELNMLSAQSTLQPELWQGIETYLQFNHLPARIASAARKTVDISEVQTSLISLGPINSLVVSPSVESTFLYMNAGKMERVGQLSPARTLQQNIPSPDKEVPPVGGLETGEEFPVSAALLNSAVANPLYATVSAEAAEAQQRKNEEIVQAFLAEQGPVKLSAENQSIIDKAKAYLNKLLPKSADDTKFSQRAALYLTAFSIGLEIGTPIMASIKSALNLPLSFAILVTAATYSPYLFGSFIANALKGKLGRKGIINTGLGLMGGSLLAGTTVLGLDGSFTAWDNPTAQYLGLLGVLTVLSTGAVFIHNAAGPVMTEISHKTDDLVRQQRGTYIELSRSIGMMASFGFPFLATTMLGMDWSAPFLLALPVVGASALALNLAKLPNTKTVPATGKVVRTSKGKLRSTTSYLHLLKDAPGVGSFISGLFVMNAVEVALNSGFLFMIPQLMADESQRYLLGFMQYSAAFLAGRILAKPFLKWFPKRNLSVATVMAATSAASSLAVTDNPYLLTAALFLAELGISTTFTLAYARTAKDQQTQDKITSLIMASAVSCAVGPMLLTTIAQGLMDQGILSETNATVATLIGIPTFLAILSAKLFRRTENKSTPGLADGPSWKQTLQTWWENFKSRF